MLIADFVTDFADQAVLLPLAVIVALVLLLAGWRRGALAWSVGVFGTLGCMLVLKMVLAACAHRLPIADLHSPSGHTASAAAVYGSLFALAAQGKKTGLRWTLPYAVTVAVTVGLSRVMLGAHSFVEVAVGGLVGVTGAVVFAALAGPHPPSLRLKPLAGAALLVVALLHGMRLPAEAAIRSAAIDIWPLSQCRE